MREYLFLKRSHNVRVGNPLIGFSSESLICCEWKSKSAIRSLSIINYNYSIWELGLAMLEMSQLGLELRLLSLPHATRHLLVHCHSFVMSDLSELLGSLFCSEPTERFVYSHSFQKSEWAKSDGSNSLFGIKRGKTAKNIWKMLTVTLLLRATLVIRSGRSLIWAI